MKKILLSLVAMVCCLTASAAIFDGIDLNANRIQVMREISVKGYVFDEQRNCLKGNCQGTEIYLSFNLEDAKDKSKIGQLIVEVPMKNATSFDDVAMTLNVIYHAISTSGTTRTYAVDTDGTTLDLVKTAEGFKLVYNTPNYEKK